MSKTGWSHTTKMAALGRFRRFFHGRPARGFCPAPIVEKVRLEKSSAGVGAGYFVIRMLCGCCHTCGVRVLSYHTCVIRVLSYHTYVMRVISCRTCVRRWCLIFVTRVLHGCYLIARGLYGCYLISRVLSCHTGVIVSHVLCRAYMR